MRKTKYVVIEFGGIESAVVFSDNLTHADVARGIGGKTLAAGFAEFYRCDGEIKVQTYGRSDSLNMSPRGEDVALLEKDIIG